MNGISILFLFLLFIPFIISFNPRLSLILSSAIYLLLSIFLLFSLLYGYAKLPLLLPFSVPLNGLFGLRSSASDHITYLTSIPYLNFSYLFDSLSLLFGFLIAFLGFIASLYSVNYLYEEHYKNKSLFVILFNGFIISMLFVVFSANGLSFLIFWEIMSILSFFLVLFKYEKEESKKAANLYIIMTHIGTFFIFLLFLYMFTKTGSFSFEAWKHFGVSGVLSAAGMLTIFILTLLGFGMKAGIFPLHVWLPKAHPEAPSSVSALMSGIMIKTAIYMMIRFYFEFMKSYGWGFGFIILLIGALTLIYGVLNAGIQDNIKRLLAYSSMENIGIMLMTLGLAMIFYSQDMYLLCAFALMALLFHILNHALFKGLLFLGSGVIASQTHTKDMNKLGGLIKKMPAASFIFLIGVLSAATLPPFNGFVSEWMIYQSLLMASSVNIEIIKVFTPIFASVMALSGGLAALAFVKAYGISFLGRARSQGANNAKEPPFLMLASMGILAFLCFLLGIFSFIGLMPINKVVKEITNISIYNNIAISYGSIVTLPRYSLGIISPIGLLAAGIICMTAIYLFIKIFGNMKTRVFETFACGLENKDVYNISDAQISQNICNAGDNNNNNNDDINVYAKRNNSQYSSTGFSQPVRRIFSKIYNIKENLINEEYKRKYFFPVKNYIFKAGDLFECFYNSFASKFLEKISKLRVYIQGGVVQTYIAYIVGALIILLIWVSWFHHAG
ncbi:MAG: proton-conducting transporter transmembrane domain-containing protein [bacterium]